MAWTRRRFLRTSGAGAAGLLGPAVPARSQEEPPPPTLPQRFSDLRRHFIFEYYPWYGTRPYRHWEQWGRRPPHDVAANYMPRLGAYDSRDRAVLEQHARWIADSGAGAINVSWWGGGSFEDRATHLLMDVMAAHDLKVAFHLEPYRRDRGLYFAEDTLYLLREFGQKRRFDALLLLRNADGSEGPVFKGFRLILPSEVRDCHGAAHRVPDYTSDREWQRQIETLRHLLRDDFHRLTLLADTVNIPRAAASGFDGIAVYDNFQGPETYAAHAAAASAAGLLFSFNVNPGFHGIGPRRFSSRDCMTFLPSVPATDDLDLSRPAGREQAAVRSAGRIADSIQATLRVQTDLGLANARRGFFLVYVNSFNEWHEGHAFEPMKDAGLLSPEEAAWRYANPERGGYRLEVLGARLRDVLGGAAPVADRRPLT